MTGVHISSSFSSSSELPTIRCDGGTPTQPLMSWKESPRGKQQGQRRIWSIADIMGHQR